MRLLLRILIMLNLMALPAHAAGLIRDADIEHALGQLARPVLQAAGLSRAQVKILLIDSRIPNAFVLDNRAIFIHTGMITRLKSAEALQAVLAHEAAHIANGHVARRMTQANTRKSVTGLGIALAAAAAASGANGSAAGALAIGVASSAQRSFLSHSGAEESSADQSAIRYLAASGISTKGAIEVHDIFKGQDTLREARQDPYARNGQPAMASLGAAERHALNGRFKDAALHAKRAVAGLSNGSGPWQRAQDVLSAVKRQK